jgi:hypothetical protein
MSRPPKSQAASLDDASRAALFLAETMSARSGRSLEGIACPIPGLRHFAGPKVDLAVVAGIAPAEREILAWVRRRQTTCMIGRLDRLGERPRLVVDVYLADGGIVALTGLRLFLSDPGRHWLVGEAADVVTIQLTPEGPIPTLTRPFADEVELVRGLKKAEEVLAAILSE